MQMWPGSTDQIEDFRELIQLFEKSTEITVPSKELQDLNLRQTPVNNKFTIHNDNNSGQ